MNVGKLFNSEYRKYLKLVRIFRRRFGKLISHIHPYDYVPLLQLIEEFLNFQFTYFKSDWNVYTNDSHRERIVGNIRKALDLYQRFVDSAPEDVDDRFREFWNFLGDNMMDWWD